MRLAAAVLGLSLFGMRVERDGKYNIMFCLRETRAMKGPGAVPLVGYGAKPRM